jgi:hypothetical protein
MTAHGRGAFRAIEPKNGSSSRFSSPSERSVTRAVLWPAELRRHVRRNPTGHWPSTSAISTVGPYIDRDFWALESRGLTDLRLSAVIRA